MTEKKTKRCRKCQRRRTITAFNKRSASPDGYRNSCRDCDRQTRVARTWRKANEEQLRPEAIAKRNAILRLIRAHHTDYDRFYQMELRLLRSREEESPESKKQWVSM